MQMANRCMKRCSASPIVRERQQVKTTARHHLAPSRAAAIERARGECGEGVEKRGIPCPGGGSVNGDGHCGNRTEVPQNVKDRTSA